MTFLDELNPMQRKAAEITNGPLLILAGAGSGKTRTVIYRIAHLLKDCDVEPYQILALTFTNKAAGEMKSRIQSFDIPGVSQIWMGTFHSICARILRMHGEAIGFNSSFTIYDTSDSKALVKSCMDTLGIVDKALNVNNVVGIISSAKNNAVSVKDFPKEYEHLYRANDMYAVYAMYTQKLKENNAMDFDDLLFNTYHLFQQRPDVLEHYQQRFLHILVDEYQDTNRLQYEIVAMIAQKHKNLCVCGDDDQSIYGWRGADIRNILEFEEDFPNAQVVRLEQNYRSTSNILNASNSLIKHNKGRKGKNLWTLSGEGEKIHILESLSDIDEGNRVAYEINKKFEEGNHKYSDFAVLYRTNAQSRVIEESLIRASVPYQIVRGTRFYERMEVKDIMAYLHLAVNDFDAVSFERAVSIPKRGIGPTCLGKLAAFAEFKGLSILMAAREPENSGTISASLCEKLRSFARIIDKINEAAQTDGLSCAVKTAIEQSGYSDYLRLTKPEDYESRIENLNELINAAADFEQSSEDSSLNAFLENAALIAGVDNLEDGDGNVLLMSIHNSKGLEFKCVFVVGMEEGLFPLPKACEDPSELEEERRLCYVAMTRAMKSLYLSYARQRRQYGTTRVSRPSRFLGEIPLELTDARASAARQIGEFEKNAIDNNVQKKHFTPPTPPSKEKKQDASLIENYAVAEKIEHPSWGVGTIIDVSGTGKDAILTVAFAGLGVKKIVPGYVAIKKVTE